MLEPWGHWLHSLLTWLQVPPERTGLLVSRGRGGATLPVALLSTLPRSGREGTAPETRPPQRTEQDGDLALCLPNDKACCSQRSPWPM